MSIAIYTLTSTLHDETSINRVTSEFLGSLQIEYELKGSDYADYGSSPLSLVFVRTGGTEGLFIQLFDRLLRQGHHPFYLLTSGKSNSLAASMEILAFLRQQGCEGEIIHGAEDYVAQRIRLLERVEKARRILRGARLGVIGKPSDWLIASHADRDAVRRILGIELVDVTMDELLEAIERAPDSFPISLTTHPSSTNTCCVSPIESHSLHVAVSIYHALKDIVGKYQLGGFTLRCFDLLSAVHNTGCLALALLNSEGVVAGCEGDVPAMLTMKVAQALTGVSGFQANPANINSQTGRMLFAHCTIPLNMVERYEFDTHFESGIGVAIRGYVKPGPVTIVKLAGDLSRSFVAEGTLLECQDKLDLCRTQMVVQLDDPALTGYFLTQPIGNHHIIIPGHHKCLFSTLFLHSIK
ncbi:MAG: hypothetical protein IKT00_12740 [Prevotella sp.]|nr:hypothetical protein [Prevotella sp.]